MYLIFSLTVSREKFAEKNGHVNHNNRKKMSKEAKVGDEVEDKVEKRKRIKEKNRKIVQKAKRELCSRVV